VKDQIIYKALSIAGFDGSGGAGIQADLKTFSALGCYGTTVLTALPVQNTVGVRSIYDIQTVCVEEQVRSIYEDIQINATKIGMLHRHAIIEAVADLLREYKVKNIVLDPVMVAKSGDKLLLLDAIAAMKEQLFPLTTVLTPNLLEASEALGREIKTRDQMEQAALELLEMGPQAVVVKGGHLKECCDDCLVIRGAKPEFHWFPSERIETKNTHGTGCTFSAAITAYLARGKSILESVSLAKAYLTRAIKKGANIEIGHGHGPVHHFHHLWDFVDVPVKD
jgi:hydroxymethylpyrimidine/phosphomethylpyrimidine kinase